MSADFARRNRIKQAIAAAPRKAERQRVWWAKSNWVRKASRKRRRMIVAGIMPVDYAELPWPPKNYPEYLWPDWESAPAAWNRAAK